MIHLRVSLLLTQWLALAASKVYTGFNYGAYWSEVQAKHRADFVEQFYRAKNLTNTPVPFDSARLFTCIQHSTQNDPIEAFDAAIETNTSLLLGFWVQDADMLNAEMIALEKAFTNHGQDLADLVIGLSVGSEDIYRYVKSDTIKGASTETVQSLVELARTKIRQSQTIAKFWQDKPIGHTDIQDYAADIKGDFIGMNTYPYWSNQSIYKANDTFFNTLKDVQKRSGNTPVWVGETGWPFAGDTRDAAVPGADNMQRYWKDVGCSLFGKVNTWWFQLEKDNNPDIADFGLIDRFSQQHRITDLSCPNITPAEGAPPADPTPQIPSNSETDTTETVYTTTTTYLTITDTQTGTPSARTVTVTTVNCVTVADVNGDGHYITVTTNPPVGVTCASASLYTPTPAPADLSTPPPSPTPIITPSVTTVTIAGCLTVADVNHDGKYTSVDMNPAVNGTCLSPSPYTSMSYKATSLTGPAPTTSLSIATPAGNNPGIPTVASSSRPAVTPLSTSFSQAPLNATTPAGAAPVTQSCKLQSSKSTTTLTKTRITSGSVLNSTLSSPLTTFSASSQSAIPVQQDSDGAPYNPATLTPSPSQPSISIQVNTTGGLATTGAASPAPSDTDTVCEENMITTSVVQALDMALTNTTGVVGVTLTPPTESLNPILEDSTDGLATTLTLTETLTPISTGDLATAPTPTESLSPISTGGLATTPTPSSPPQNTDEVNPSNNLTSTVGVLESAVILALQQAGVAKVVEAGNGEGSVWPTGLVWPTRNPSAHPKGR